MKTLKLTTIHHPKFGELGLLKVNGDTLYPTADCCYILGFTNSTNTVRFYRLNPVKYKVETLTKPYPNGERRIRAVTKSFIAADDLNRLIRYSLSPNSKEFESWIFQEAVKPPYRNREEMTRDAFRDSQAAYDAGLYEPQFPGSAPEGISDLKFFQNPEFGKLGVLMIDGKPYFPATECAKILGYKDPARAIKQHCRWVVKRRLWVQTGVKADGSPAMRQSEVNFIPQSDLLRLVLRSNLPAAERFQTWIVEDVIPSILQHGVYATDAILDAMVDDVDFGFKVLTALKKERAEKARLQLQITEDAPKVEFANAVAAADKTVSMGTLAKIIKGRGIDTGRTRLLNQLRDWGYLLEQGSDKNMPSQWAMNLDLFRVKEYFMKDDYGRDMLVKTTMVTGKGQQHILDRFLKEFTPKAI